MIDDGDVKGNLISISHDYEGGQDWIVIRDCSGNLILKIQHELWENAAGTEFTPELRDSILCHIRRLYG